MLWGVEWHPLEEIRIIQCRTSGGQLPQNGKLKAVCLFSGPPLPRPRCLWRNSLTRKPIAATCRQHWNLVTGSCLFLKLNLLGSLSDFLCLRLAHVLCDCALNETLGTCRGNRVALHHWAGGQKQREEMASWLEFGFLSSQWERCSDA